MNWIEITAGEQIEEIRALSKTQPVVIFKHSTRCSISSMAKARLERAPEPLGITCYYLDLIRYRAISNQVAEYFHVYHESPQVLLIKDGECVYDESHNGIAMDEIVRQSMGTHAADKSMR